MSCPATALPDPHGGAAQAAYPWRGRVTCFPGPSQPGTADKTAAARAQIQAFSGTAYPAHFSIGDDTVAFNGPGGDWGFRRLILHYAHIALAAGGVDAFLVGSEMRGLTTLRDGANAFPFVEVLCELADQVKSLLGPATDICYGADWTEYFGHQPADGSGDVFFHLDPLWARPSVSAVGIDNYTPLSDWRDADYHAGNPDGASGPYDPAALRAAIRSGEGFDWHYASFAAREARVRSPISDGAYGKPWVFRHKDLVGWWSNAHFNRVGGVEMPTPTAWVPRGKPIWFTELGCPAVDKGPNQPNVFIDPKSSESFAPYFSDGGRSDLAVRRYLEAHAAHWDPASPSFDPAGNPLSPVHGGRMLDHRRSYVWCWDARPFPAFPLRADVWRDGTNWHLGHWLNGRLEGPDAGALINAILADHGLPAAEVAEADGTLQGYVIDEPGSARSALEPVVDIFGLAVCEGPNGLAFRSARSRSAAPLAVARMVVEEGGATLERTRVPDHELPASLVLVFRDHLTGYQSASVRSVRPGAAGRREQTISFPGVLEREQAQALAADGLRRAWAARETISLSVASYREGLEPGAVITVPEAGTSEFLVTEVEDGLVRRLKARRLERAAPQAWAHPPATPLLSPVIHAGTPHVLFLDLPARAASTAPQDLFRVAVWQKPWRSQLLLASPENTGFSPRLTIERPADVGELAEALPPGVREGRVDRSNVVVVDLFDTEAQSISRLQSAQRRQRRGGAFRDWRVGNPAIRDGGRSRARTLAAWRPAARSTRHQRRHGGGFARRRAFRHAERTRQGGGAACRRDRPAAQLADRSLRRHPVGRDLRQPVGDGRPARASAAGAGASAMPGIGRRRSGLLMGAARTRERRRLGGDRHSARRGARGIPRGCRGSGRPDPADGDRDLARLDLRGR